MKEPLVTKRAENLVGRDVQESGNVRLARQRCARSAKLLQQCEGADDIGLNEFAGPIDRSIDMALGGEIHHRVGLILLEQFTEAFAVANGVFLKRVLDVVGGAGQRV